MTKRIQNISIKEFREFLNFHGLKKIRTSGGHETWSRKDLLRPITFQSHIDPVPTFIIINCLRSIGLTSKDLREYFNS